MSEPLIRPWTLVGDSARQFIQTWDTTVRITSWLILVAALNALSTLLSQNPLLAIFGFLIDVIGVMIALWTSIRLFKTIFAIERGQKVTNETTADVTKLIWPLFLIQVITLVSVIGGLILFVIPGLYIGIRLAFAQTNFLDPDSTARNESAMKQEKFTARIRKYTESIRASWDLTRDKFWPILGRFLLGSLVFGIITAFAMFLATFIVEGIAGPQFAAAASAKEPPAAVLAAMSIIQGIVQASLISAVAIFQVKLYESLKRSK